MLFNRRRVLTTTAAAIAFGAARPFEILPSALAQPATNPLNPTGATFHKFKVDTIDVITVFDGGLMRDIPPDFVKNASTDDIKNSLRAAGMPDAQLPNTYTVPIIDVGGRKVMFDSGNGAGRTAGAGLLSENMKAAGVAPADLAAIVITHLHPDHIFGLYGPEDAPLYPNTEIIVPETEYKYWADPAVIEALPEGRRGIARRVQASMPKWNNIRQVAIGAEILPGITSIGTPGHTPGHTSYRVTSGTGTLMVLGDVTAIPPTNLRNPGWHVVFDQDAVTAEATRRRTLDQVVADRVVCTGYHWGMPGAGTVAKDGSGYVLQPVA